MVVDSVMTGQLHGKTGARMACIWSVKLPPSACERVVHHPGTWARISATSWLRAGACERVGPPLMGEGTWVLLPGACGHVGCPPSG